MGTADEIHVMFLQEARYDVGAEGEGHASVVFAPAGDVLVRVGPQEIAEETAVGNLCAGKSANCYPLRDPGTDAAYISRPHNPTDLLH